MTGKEILGIYAAQGRTSYYCVKKRLSGFKEVSPGPGLSFSGEAEQGGAAGVREILRKIRFDSKRSIFLALPRSLFFAREVKLPMMPAEDAIDAVKNSMSLYSHLPCEEIYYDIIVIPSFKDSTRCLFVYARKKTMDHYRDMFRETGHFDSLVSVFPISYGVCAWMQQNNKLYPAGVVLEYEREIELSVFDNKYWLSSVTWNCADGKSGELAFKSLTAQFPGISDNFYRVKVDTTMKRDDLQEGWFAKAETIDPLLTHIAAAAVSPAFCKIQQISLDEKPVKVKLVKPLRYIMAMVCIIAALLFYLTGNLSKDIKIEQVKRDKLKNLTAQLQKKIEPVQERVKILKKAAAVKEDAELFLRLRPRLYTCVNEIARLVPEGTWFSGLRFQKDVINLHGYSEDALTTVKILRKSKLFSKVRLKGSVVSRRANGKEQFNLELTLNLKQKI